MPRVTGALLATIILVGSAPARADDAKPAATYFAHPAAEDAYGVIAPWYRGQNGQCDFRVRVAAETLKRYPWADKNVAVMPAPHFVFNGTWSIKPDGAISVNPKLSDWDNGDVGQRSASLLSAFTNYYGYTGDPAAIGLIALTADYLLDYCQTPADHLWPRFLIGCPTKGKAYARANPHGFIQLDITAFVGSQLLKAYKLTGNTRYLDAVRHWADLLAEHCDCTPGHTPWHRYANPKDSSIEDRQTGSISIVLQFLDDVIRLGYTGKDGLLLRARDAGEKHVRDVILPAWTRDPTFGYFFWDWANPTYTCSIPCIMARYMMTRREAFPNWKTDSRNIVSMILCRLSVNPASSGDVYSGAWAFPESSTCCGKSLQYPTMMMAPTLARYGIVAASDWAREVARRQSILMTYDARATGVVVDGIDGTIPVAGTWFNLAHPWPMLCTLEAIGWQPELLGPNRENHIMRSTSVVRAVRYGKGRVAYATFDAPPGTEDVLRLAFEPKSIMADGKPLAQRERLTENGYTLKMLFGEDFLVSVRHDGCREIMVEGVDPQATIEDDQLQFEGPWSVMESPDASGGRLRVASQQGAAASFTFEGNQVRVIGRADPRGGKADVYLDGVKQLCGIDFWCPQAHDQQVVCYKNGLKQGRHTIRVVASGTKNPRSQAAHVYLDALQWSAAQGESGFGEGSGPVEPQRVIFGYFARQDYVDSQNHVWRPATEFTMRLGAGADLVPLAFSVGPRIKQVGNTADPELYRYGVSGKSFTTYFTVNPKGTYSVRIKLCQAAAPPTPGGYATTIDLQGRTVAKDVDIAATAGGLGKAVDLVYNDVRPEHGVIAVRAWHRFAGKALVQAIEVVPGPTR